MSPSSKLSGLISWLPDGRLKNYLTAIRRNAQKGNFFRIKFDIFRNVWKITFDDCEFTFSRDPYDRFKEDISILRKMPAWSPEVIIDANPGEGITSILLARNNPDAMVYMFEPDADEYQIMMENMFHNNLPNIVVVPRKDTLLGGFLVNEIAGHFFDKSIVLKLHLPECSQEMISIIADIWRYNHLRVILTTKASDKISYSYDVIGKTCSEQGLPFIFNRYDQHMPVFINERNLLG